MRLILALMVVVQHLWPQLSKWVGAYAVYAFFVLSGYLMTLVLNTRYGFSPGGTVRYLSNRALRIYPAYWAVALISFAVLLTFPEISRPLKKVLSIPITPISMFENIVIFGLVDERRLLVPPAWSLDIELTYYVLMGLLLSRWRPVMAVWFVASAVWTIDAVLDGESWRLRYHSHLAASLAFSMGALVFHLREKWRIGTGGAVLWCSAFFLNAAFASLIWPDVRLAGFYVSILLSGAIVLALSQQSAQGRLRKLDELAGDLAYPVFLCHWPCAALLVGLFPSLGPAESARLFWATLPLTLLVAYGINMMVERPVNRIRDTIRSRVQRRPSAA